MMTLPEQVWQMFVESGARYLVPIHWGTFRLGFEPEGDAMRRLSCCRHAGTADSNRYDRLRVVLNLNRKIVHAASAAMTSS